MEKEKKPPVSPWKAFHFMEWRIVFSILGVIIIILLVYLVNNVSRIKIAETKVANLEKEEKMRIQIMEDLKDRLKTQDVEIGADGKLVSYNMVILDDKTVLIDDKELDFDQLGSFLEGLNISKDTTLSIKIHNEIKYHTVENLINILRGSGYLKVGLVSINLDVKKK